MTFHSAHIHIHNGGINLHGILLKQQGSLGTWAMGTMSWLKVIPKVIKFSTFEM